MDGRHAQSAGTALSTTPTLQRSEPPAPLRRRFAAARGQLPVWWAVALGVGWPLAVIVGSALEPAPAHAHAAAATPFLVSVASVAALAGVYAIAALAMHRHLYAAAVGVLTGVVLMAMSAACPLSGHHTFGMWWVAQFGLIVAMLGVSLAALRVSDAGGRGSPGSPG